MFLNLAYLEPLGTEIYPRFCQGFFVNEMAGFQQYTSIPADIVGKVIQLLLWLPVFGRLNKFFA